MTATRNTELWVFAAVALAMSGLAALSVIFTRFNGGVALVWPAGSVLLAVLVNEKVARWPPFLLAGAGGLIAQSLVVGPGWQIAMVMDAIRLMEPAIAALLLGPVLGVGVDIKSMRGMAWFIAIAGLFAPAVSGIPAAWVVMHTAGTHYLTGLNAWIAAHGLGAIIFTPIFSALATRDWCDTDVGPCRGYWWKTMLLVAVSGVVDLLVFEQGIAPLLFLPMVPMAYATLQGGRPGAMLSIALLAAIATVETVRVHGPVYLFDASTGSRSLLLQGYIACAAFLVLPISALLVERGKLTAGWRDSEARYRAIAESLGDAAIDVGPDAVIRYASPAIADITGRDADAMVGASARMLVCDDDRPVVNEAYRNAMARPGTAAFVQYRGPPDGDGRQRWFEASIRALRRDGRFDGVLGSVRDISDRKAVELSLARDAAHDALTGLMNRRALMEELERRCEQATSHGGRGSLALVDLDHFKHVNDRHGHAVGDLVLQGIADITRNLFRGDDRFARLGGEEFALLLWDVTPPEALAAAERLRSAIESMVLVVDGGSLTITASVGLITLAPGMIPGDALKWADIALYDAKRAGRNCVRAGP